MGKKLFLMAAVLCALCANAQNVENGHEYVDLGLPSGLKWATMNVGATAPEASGDHFAWGETAAKETYLWDNYKHGTADNQLTKYCGNSDYGLNGFTDNKTMLDPEDDVASVNWGGAWRTPTDDEWTELREQCDWTWTADYNSTGVAGRIVTSKVNGNSIFLPAAGTYGDSGLTGVGDYGFYWSSSLNTNWPNFAWYMYFHSTYIDAEIYDYRYLGQTVRPVAVIYTVTVNAAENGTVEADRTTAQMGDEVTLTVAPDEGFVLAQLVVKQGETEIAVSADYKFVMPAGDVVVNATFKKTDYTVTVNVSENGTVEADRTTAQIGDEVTLTVTPAEGFVLVQLVVKQGETEIAVSADYKFVMPAGDVVVNATFKKTDYTVTVNAAENGTVEADKTTAQMGDEITLTVAPAEGYELDQLIVKQGETGITVSKGKFTMPAGDVVVTATFKQKTPTAIGNAENVTIYAENGRIVCDGDFRIYDVLGRDVTRMNGSLNGVYVVKVGGHARKIVVR